MFLEPLGHNLLINLYRHLTPDLRTAEEHPLLVCKSGADRQLLPRGAYRVFYPLYADGPLPFRRLPRFKVPLWVLERIDGLLRLPFVKRHAWLGWSSYN